MNRSQWRNHNIGQDDGYQVRETDTSTTVPRDVRLTTLPRLARNSPGQLLSRLDHVRGTRLTRHKYTPSTMPAQRTNNSTSKTSNVKTPFTPKPPRPAAERLPKLYRGLTDQINEGHLANAKKTCKKSEPRGWLPSNSRSCQS